MNDTIEEDDEATTFEFPDGDVDPLQEGETSDPWRFLQDIQQWVKQSTLHEWADHSDDAKALLSAETFIELSATHPVRERSDRPDTWTGQLYVLDAVTPIRIAPRDGLRTSLLVVSFSNVAVPQADGSSLAASNGWVTLSPRPIPRNGFGPGPGRNSVPPGGSRNYDSAAECWAIASVAGTVIEVTQERHNRGVKNDSTSMDAE